jgi:hypothetical protein
MGDSSLIENLDRARVQAACARAAEFLGLAALDDDDLTLDPEGCIPRRCQLAVAER